MMRAFHLPRPLKWRAWYYDGTVYDSSKDRWRDLPQCYCMAVVVNGNSFTVTDCVGLNEETGLAFQLSLPRWTGQPEEALIDICQRMFSRTSRDDWKLGRETDMGNWRSLEYEIAQYVESMK